MKNALSDEVCAVHGFHLSEAWLSRLPWAQEVFYDLNRAVMETQAKA
jgi:hypothetical protein